jgi:hypothetical protein
MGDEQKQKKNSVRTSLLGGSVSRSSDAALLKDYDSRCTTETTSRLKSL